MINVVHREICSLLTEKLPSLAQAPLGWDAPTPLCKKAIKITIYGIQKFKPAGDMWQEKWEEFERAGVKFVPNISIGKDKTIDDLFEEGFDAVFIDVSFEIDTKLPAQIYPAFTRRLTF